MSECLDGGPGGRLASRTGWWSACRRPNEPRSRLGGRHLLGDFRREYLSSGLSWEHSGVAECLRRTEDEAWRGGPRPSPTQEGLWAGRGRAGSIGVLEGPAVSDTERVWLSGVRQAPHNHIYPPTSPEGHIPRLWSPWSRVDPVSTTF